MASINRLKVVLVEKEKSGKNFHKRVDRGIMTDWWGIGTSKDLKMRPLWKIFFQMGE